MDKYNEMVKLIDSMKVDVEKCLIKGNKKAGIRVRANIQVLKKMAQELRKIISEHNKL